VQYRLNQPMMVLAFKDNHQLAVTVPVGKIVDVGKQQVSATALRAEYFYHTGCNRRNESP
jgi:hypothetical protein